MDADERKGEGSEGKAENRRVPICTVIPPNLAPRALRSNLGALYVTTAARNRRLRALSRAVRRTLRSAAESQA